MASELNIYQKIVEIRKTINGFTKDTKGYNYSYVSGSQVLGKIKEKMDELYVVLQPEIPNTLLKEQVEVEVKGKLKKEWQVSGDMNYVWINAEKPEEKVTVPWQLFGQQDDPSKAFGTSLTYSERYFLMKYFGIPTDDDDPDKRQGSPQGNNNSSYNNGSQQKPSSKQIGLIKTQVKKIAVARKKKDEDVYAALNVDDINKLTQQQASSVITTLNKWVDQLNNPEVANNAG